MPGQLEGIGGKWQGHVSHIALWEIEMLKH